MPTLLAAIKNRFSTLLNWLGRLPAPRQQVKPDDHSEVVPLLPIPNRTVKRLCADDSADSRVKVGHCQANIEVETPEPVSGVFAFGIQFFAANHCRAKIEIPIDLRQRVRL